MDPFEVDADDFGFNAFQVRGDGEGGGEEDSWEEEPRDKSKSISWSMTRLKSEKGGEGAPAAEVADSDVNKQLQQPRARGEGEYLQVRTTLAEESNPQVDRNAIPISGRNLVSSSTQTDSASPADPHRLDLDTNHKSASEERDKIEIPHDTFSMFYVAEDWHEHILPAGIFALQILILVLISMNLMQTRHGRLITRMNLPVGVPPSVTVSQYVACLVSVFTADDLVAALLFSNKRLVRGDFLPANGQAPKLSPKWELANLMRGLEGAMVIVVTFFLIVQSVEAIELWLNFAGVSFVGYLDDVAFALAKHHFLGIRARALSERVADVSVHMTPKAAGEGRRRKIRCVFVAGITAALWIGLTIVVTNQYGQKYACRSVTLTVAESRFQWARHFSGSYSLSGDVSNGRGVYYQNQAGGVRIAYCTEGINRWVVSNLDDPCEDFIMQSERTRTYDIYDITDLRFKKTGTDAGADLKCNDCHTDKDCSWRGRCNKSTKSCECAAGFFGASCQFKGPCTEMQMEDEFHGYHDHADMAMKHFKKSFDLLYHEGQPVMVHDRPVYTQRLNSVNKEGKQYFGIIFFDGGRWEVLHSYDFLDKYWSNEGETEDNLAHYLVHNFTSQASRNWSSYESWFLSEPTNLGYPAHVPFRAWLTGGGEFSPYVGELGDEEFRMYCADCDKTENDGTSTCVNRSGWTDFGRCETRMSAQNTSINRCRCEAGFRGPLCQIRPVEGTVSLYLDHGTDVCSVCNEGNIWSVWELNGIRTTCLPFPPRPLTFESASGTTLRQMFLTLNNTHFSVMVSSRPNGIFNNTAGTCSFKEGSHKIYSFLRNGTDERIKVDFAIHLNETEDFYGYIIDPASIDCRVNAEVDQDLCYSNMTEVYYDKTSQKSLLKDAWIHLNLKVSPVIENV